MYKGTEIINYMEKHLGDRGAEARAYCHLGAGQPWCNAEVTYAFHEIGESKLFCNGRKETYCPHSIQWCYKNLASLPIYLALEGDIVYFDWERNGVPNHIGFARHRISDLQLATVEGNTSGGKIDNKVREAAYIQAVFRPLYPVDEHDFDAYQKLEIDGYIGFNSIAVMQRFLMIEVDGSCGVETVKAWQKFLGVPADGDWGTKTTKATQKLVGVKQDGYCGKKTVIGLQKWLNKQVFSGGQPITKPSTTTTSSSKKSNGQKIGEKAHALAYKTNSSKANYPKGKPTEAFKKALNEVYPSHDKWGTAPSKGASCDVFVGTVIRASGVDKKFPRGLDEQWPHLKSSDKFKTVEAKLSNLKDGDIITYMANSGTGHICIYYGGKIKEAGYQHYYGKTTNSAKDRISKSGKKWVKAYRAK